MWRAGRPKARGSLVIGDPGRKNACPWADSDVCPEEATMAKYRRRYESDTWHWCWNCSHWPTSDYVDRDSKPSSGKLCNQCRAKQTVGTCEG